MSRLPREHQSHLVQAQNLLPGASLPELLRMHHDSACRLQ